MTVIEVNYLVRLLSSVYVYFWIPIRLNYLRLKIKLRPVLMVSGEVFAITALISTGVPLSVIYMFAKGTKHLIKLWVTSLCKLIAITAGVEYEKLYDSILSDDCSEETINEPIEISEGNNGEQPIDDKNKQESTEELTENQNNL